LLTGGDATLQGDGQGRAKQGAALRQGELLTSGQDRAVRSVLGNLAQLRDVGDRLLQGKPLGIVSIRNRQRRHRYPSQRMWLPSASFLPSPRAKIERGTRPRLSASPRLG